MNINNRNKDETCAGMVEIHKEDLLVDCGLAVAGEPVFKIDPLKIKMP